MSTPLLFFTPLLPHPSCNVHTRPSLASNTTLTAIHPEPQGNGHERKSTGRVLLRPLSAHALCVLLVLLVMLRDVGREGVVWVWRAQEGLYGEEDGADLEGRGPFVWCGAM